MAQSKRFWKTCRRLAQAPLITGLLVAAAMCPATAAPGESQTSPSAAQRALDKGDAATAVIELKNAIRANPADAQARYQLAVLYFAQGNAEGAISELETARAQGFDQAKVLPLLAQCYGALGRFKDLTGISTAGLTGQTRAAILSAQTRAHLTLGDPQAARRAADEALAAAPGQTDAVVASAMVLMTEGKLAEAEAELGKAGDPNQADVLVLRGDLRFRQNDPYGAMKHFDLAVSKYPMNAAGRIQRATVNISRGQIAPAREDVDWVLGRQPQQPLALYLKAHLLAVEKKYAEASQTLLALPGLLQRYSPAMFLLAETTLRDGRHEIALDYAQRYRRAAPDDANGVKLLARVHQQMKKPELAVAALEPLAARYPDDKAIGVQFAGALLEAGRSEEAVKLFQHSLSTDPTNSQAQLALAVGQLRTGQTDQAIAQIEKTVQAEPDSLQANTLLVLTHLQLGHRDKAKGAASAMVAANANDPNAHNLLGTVYLSTNELLPARAAFQATLQKDAKFLPAFLNLGRVEERTANWPAAEGWYQKTLAIDPGNLTAHQRLASIALRDGKVDEAVALLKKAAARDPAVLEPRVMVINILLEKKRTAQALIEARELVSAAPRAPEALDALARAQIAGGDLEGGLASYQRLAAQNPDNAEAQRRFARALLSVPGDKAKVHYESAAAALDAAVNAAPEDLALLGDRIELERRAVGAQGGLSLAQQYAAERPDSAARLIVLADTQLIERRPEALATYRKAWELTKNSTTAGRLYASLALSGKGDEGLKVLTDWTAKNPNDHDIRFLIANHYLRTGNTAKAIAETEALSAVFPDNPVLLNNLAWLYAEPNPAKARQFAERAYTLAPDWADVLDTLGWLRVAASDVAGGEQLLRQAHEAAPERADIAFHYAVALEKNNKPADARRVLERTLKDPQEFAERVEAQALFQKLSVR